MIGGSAGRPQGTRSRTAPPLVLASTSPRRRDLLARLGIPFDVVDPGVDEVPFERLPPRAQALASATAKAQAVARRHRGRTILAADTIVSLDGRSLGKPTDAVDARRMLHALRGRTHAVFTAAVVLDETGERSRIARSLVTFKQLTDAEIDAYIASGDPLDKAGGYGIQALDDWVAGISGAKDTVMGLPLHAVRQLLQTGPQPPVR